MSIIGHFPKYIHEEKHCFVYCGPDRCDCRAGNPLDITAQILNQQVMKDATRAQHALVMRTCLGCGAKPDPYGNLPCPCGQREES